MDGLSAAILIQSFCSVVASEMSQAMKWVEDHLRQADQVQGALSIRHCT